MHLAEVDVQDVFELILKLDNHKAMGINNAIPTRFIKVSSASMATLLVWLINKTLFLLFSQTVGKLPLLHLF